MEELLDNPVWNGLCSGNSQLALGNAEVKYYDAEVSPFVAFSNDPPQHFETLSNLLSRETPTLFFSKYEVDVPAPWKVLKAIPGLQMVHNGTPVKDIDIENVKVLSETDIPQMLALTRLTQPGPFATRTIEFGHYAGIFEGDKLVAMAGQRFYPKPYAEISAVCTHPDSVGKGYARQLLVWQINRLIAAGDIPMLHLAASNSRALKVYESVGFSIRMPVWFYLIENQK